MSVLNISTLDTTGSSNQGDITIHTGSSGSNGFQTLDRDSLVDTSIADASGNLDGLFPKVCVPTYDCPE